MIKALVVFRCPSCAAGISGLSILVPYFTSMMTYLICHTLVAWNSYARVFVTWGWLEVLRAIKLLSLWENRSYGEYSQWEESDFVDVDTVLSRSWQVWPVVVVLSQCSFTSGFVFKVFWPLRADFELFPLPPSAKVLCASVSLSFTIEYQFEENYRLLIASDISCVWSTESQFCKTLQFGQYSD